MNVISNVIRGIDLRFVAYTRALTLCARMNREIEILDFIDKIGEGGVLYDLGACEGRFAIYAALRGVRCIAFEPEELNFRALTENIALTGERPARLLTPLRYAVGETTHATTIRIGQPWAGGHHRVVADVARSDLNFNFVSEQKIDVVSLDDFIAAGDMPFPGYLKVDIDGSELSFVKGAERTLQNPMLKGVMFELYTEDDSYIEIIEFLSSSGFVEFARSQVEPNLFNIWFVRQ